MHGTKASSTPLVIREEPSAAPGHNGGPPLEEHTPEWGSGGIGNYFYWKAAHRAAWKNPSPGIVMFRIRKAERLGLSYQEYTLEILERGRHLQIEDADRIAEIKSARPVGRTCAARPIQEHVFTGRSQPSCLRSKSTRYAPRLIFACG